MAEIIHTCPECGAPCEPGGRWLDGSPRITALSSPATPTEPSDEPGPGVAEYTAFQQQAAAALAARPPQLAVSRLPDAERIAEKIAVALWPVVWPDPDDPLLLTEEIATVARVLREEGVAE